MESNARLGEKKRLPGIKDKIQKLMQTDTKQQQKSGYVFYIYVLWNAMLDTCLCILYL